MMKGEHTMTKEEMNRIFKAAMHTTPEEMQEMVQLMAYAEEHLEECGVTDKKSQTVMTGSIILYYGKELAKRNPDAPKQ